MLILGAKNSGRSELIRLFEPSHVTFFSPQFSNDKKKLIQDLSAHSKKSVIGIESTMPSLRETTEVFFKELALLSKIRKQTYLIEWQNRHAKPMQVLKSPFIRYVHTIVLARGLEVETPFVDDRFASIGNLFPDADDLRTLKYSVLYHDKSECLEPEEFTYNLTSDTTGGTNGRI